jgi:flagellar hook assembly protein FlgD
VPTSSNVKVVVYNSLGAVVKTLVNGWYDAGYYRTTWNGTDERGQKVASGVYVYRLEANGFAATNKMLLMK